MSHPIAFATAAVTAGAPSRLVTLGTIDLVIIAVYFALVLGIGFYLKRYTKTGEDFFMAGREMTAWIAGLSFVAANLGALELMGWPAPPISTASWPRTGTGWGPSRRCSSWAS